jgi:uncharacterized protein (TIRG00374 family)
MGKIFFNFGMHHDGPCPMKIKDILKLALSLLIISGIVWYLYSGDYFASFDKIGLADWAILIGLTLCLYLLSGLQMLFLVKFVSGKRITTADVLFMPMSMSMFSYFIPTNGGFFYAVYFLRKKYQVESAQGFSVGVVSIYISFIIAGVALLVASLMLGIFKWYLVILAVLLMLSPVLIHFMNQLIQRIPAKEGRLTDRIKKYLDRIISHANAMMRNRRIVIINVLITLASLLVFFLLYYRLNASLQMGLPLLSIIAMIAMMRISSLIRLLPGNLGLEELFTAAIFGIIGHDPNAGLVFSVFLRLCAVLIMIPVGVFHTAFNSNYFSFSDLKAIWKRK